MEISYAITVCNEDKELKRLLDFLIKNVKEGDEIVVQCDKENTTIEVLRVLNKCADRVKVVEFPLNGHFADFKNNLTEEWGWIVSDDGKVNWPDPQWRIYKNDPKIRWKNKVHEVLDGYTTKADLPYLEEWALYHPKTIDRQVKQNELYSKL